jgi:dienelactone hydrolase
VDLSTIVFEPNRRKLINPDAPKGEWRQMREHSEEGEEIMHTQLMAYRDQDTPLTGFFVWDDAQTGRRPGILVIHGGAGLDEHAKQRAQRIAELGFVAFACDMYGDGIAGDRQRIMACVTELRADPERLCRRAQAGIDVLASNPHVDGRFAAVGY